jgi:hypothetical protein
VKHAREDYMRIQDPWNDIPDDEPVMLFRAQDELFEEVCRFYAKRLKEKYGERTADMQALTLSHAELGAVWPKKKEPDLPANGVPK